VKCSFQLLPASWLLSVHRFAQRACQDSADAKNGLVEITTGKQVCIRVRIQTLPKKLSGRELRNKGTALAGSIP
jgi:hypothetical protein